MPNPHGQSVDGERQTPQQWQLGSLRISRQGKPSGQLIGIKNKTTTTQASMVQFLSDAGMV